MLFTLIFDVFLLIFLSYSSLTLAQGNSLREAEKRILDDILNPSKYDKRIRPNVESTENSLIPEGGPVLTKLSFYIREIESYSEEKAEIRIRITFRLTWKDSRLAYQAPSDLKYIPLRDPSVIWVPNIVFSDERSSLRTGALNPSTVSRIFPNGTTWYSSTFTLTLACPHDYSYYPFDRPVCRMKIFSYAYTTDDVVLLWRERDPLPIAGSARNPAFSLNRTDTDYCTSRTNTGEYSCAVASLTLKRDLHVHLVKNYTPTTLFVLVSYVALFLKSTSHRLFLTSITLLIFKIDATLNESKRPSQLITALDVWVCGCLGFSFASLLITIIIDYCGNRQQGSCNGINANDVQVEQNEQLAELIDEKTLQTRGWTCLQKLKAVLGQRQSILLFIIRLVYPLTFAVFTHFYINSVMSHLNERDE